MSEPIIEFSDGLGYTYGEGPSVALDFGTVQAQSLSTPKPVQVENIGAAPLQDAIVDCVAFTIANGFGSDAQVGDPEDTYDAVTFSKATDDPWENSGNGWPSVAVGTGAVQSETSPTGGTIGVSATDSFWARWEPPAGSVVGAKIWGMQITGNYT